MDRNNKIYLQYFYIFYFSPSFNYFFPRLPFFVILMPPSHPTLLMLAPLRPGTFDLARHSRALVPSLAGLVYKTVGLLCDSPCQ